MIACLVPFQVSNQEGTLKEYTIIHTYIQREYILGTKEYIKYDVASKKYKQLNYMYFMLNSQDANVPIRSIKFGLRSLL